MILGALTKIPAKFLEKYKIFFCLKNNALLSHIVAIKRHILVLATGCSSSSVDSFQINDRMSICSVRRGTSKTYSEVANACDKENGFYLTSEQAQVVIGRPSEQDWSTVALQAKQLGYNFVVTGEPVRDCAWDDWGTNIDCGSEGNGGWGYISLSESSTGDNWNALVDGINDPENWPSANRVNAQQLMSLCVRTHGFMSPVIFKSDIVQSLARNNSCSNF